MPAILKNAFVQWVLLAAVVTLLLIYIPKDWIPKDGAQRRSEMIGVATSDMMPSDIGFHLGTAAGNAFSCGYRIDSDSVVIVLSQIQLGPHVIADRGILRSIWLEGYKAGIIDGTPPKEFCELTLANYGPKGSIIPSLVTN